jgi:hypothetical protein
MATPVKIQTRGYRINLYIAGQFLARGVVSMPLFAGERVIDALAQNALNAGPPADAVLLTRGDHNFVAKDMIRSFRVSPLLPRGHSMRETVLLASILP